ncbi:hypothetical protein KFK09_024667 [Dendrobium nobile]|uniref:Uncharacterized protein n=1 Tax=Dendrobium nobile TaxID=94219 RepID=A0A8T3AEG9_DENNO|nr:hypothetical protein KFK09_024667 [Dendrobium nobile]
MLLSAAPFAEFGELQAKSTASLPPEASRFNQPSTPEQGRTLACLARSGRQSIAAPGSTEATSGFTRGTASTRQISSLLRRLTLDFKIFFHAKNSGLREIRLFQMSDQHVQVLLWNRLGPACLLVSRGLACTVAAAETTSGPSRLRPAAPFAESGKHPSKNACSASPVASRLLEQEQPLASGFHAEPCPASKLADQERHRELRPIHLRQPSSRGYSVTP